MSDKRQWETGWKCPACKQVRKADGLDPCLGVLPCVKYACCGHGGRSDTMVGGYVYFENGICIRFDKLTRVEYDDNRLSVIVAG